MYLTCNREAWENSVTEWFTLNKYIWNKIKNVGFYEKKVLDFTSPENRPSRQLGFGVGMGIQRRPR